AQALREPLLERTRGRDEPRLELRDEMRDPRCALERERGRRIGEAELRRADDGEDARIDAPGAGERRAWREGARGGERPQIARESRRGRACGPGHADELPV